MNISVIFCTTKKKTKTKEEQQQLFPFLFHEKGNRLRFFLAKKPKQTNKKKKQTSKQTETKTNF